MGKNFVKNVVGILILCLVTPSIIFASGSKDVKYTYSSSTSNYIAEKLSHPDSNIKEADGIIDFENGDPDTGQNYSWSSLGYGEYMYIGTCYAAMYQTIQKMAYELNMDIKEFRTIVDALYNGTLYMGDEKNNPNATNRAVIIKLNTKTLEVSIIESPSKIGGYRASIEFKDKLYFSAAGSTPYLLEIDPETDETKIIYKSSKPTNPSISTGIRGLTVVEDELVASMIGDNGAYIVSSKNPSDGESSFKIIATQEDLLDYPAYLYTDSIFGGSVWDMVSFKDKLYFTVVTGKNGNKTAFAMFSGEKNDNGDWSFKPIIGKEEDNAKYPLGLGASRSGAANLEVFEDHLYIGGYNDPMIAIADILNFNFENLCKDLSEPVNLWRMDEGENIELVAGEANELFSTVVGNQSSGFGSNLTQYVWDMEVYQGKLYLGTFNIGSLAYPVMQFTNGDVLKMTPEEIKSQIRYIKELIEILKNKNKELLVESESNKESNNENVDNELSIEDINTNEEQELKEENDSDDVEEQLLKEDINESEYIDIKEENNNENVRSILSENEEIIDSLNILNENLTVVSDKMDFTYEDSSKKTISGQEEVLQSLEQAQEIYEEYKTELSKEAVSSLDNLLSKDTIQNFKYFIQSCKYLSKGNRGFSLLVSQDGTNFEKITNDGFSDPYNHGLRTFSKTTNGLCIGTANPFKGTQVWRIVDNSSSPVENSKVDKTDVTYDKYEKGELKFKISYNGNTLEYVEKEYIKLKENEGFNLVDGDILFNQEYLNTLSIGSHRFRFRFSNNGFVDVNVNIIDSQEDKENPKEPVEDDNLGGTEEDKENPKEPEEDDNLGGTEEDKENPKEPEEDDNLSGTEEDKENPKEPEEDDNLGGTEEDKENPKETEEDDNLGGTEEDKENLKETEEDDNLSGTEENRQESQDEDKLVNVETGDKFRIEVFMSLGILSILILFILNKMRKTN